MEPVYAIYVDEHGETGGDLTSPQQPFYVLFATFVQAGSPYLALEASLREVAAGLAIQLGLKHLAPLHAVELYQRAGLYRNPTSGGRLGVGQAVESFLKITRLVAQGAEGFVAVHLDKGALAGLLGKGRLSKEGLLYLREALFAQLLEEVASQLRANKGYGFLFVESRSSPQDVPLLGRVFAKLRSSWGDFPLLGVPSAVSKEHLMTAVADFPAYRKGGVGAIMPRFSNRGSMNPHALRRSG
ncbi:hypothetical protein TJA_24820 [Thermus sp. LT1-2-5]|uniref:hypothetical protein n=1 Tax=Thermus sp. LT1-2-5 TaxID=3026935 RepID=UPI0030E74BE3